MTLTGTLEGVLCAKARYFSDCPICPGLFSLWEKNAGLLGLLTDGVERPKSVSVIRRGASEVILRLSLLWASRVCRGMWNAAILSAVCTHERCLAAD